MGEYKPEHGTGRHNKSGAKLCFLFPPQSNCSRPTWVPNMSEFGPFIPQTASSCRGSGGVDRGPVTGLPDPARTPPANFSAQASQTVRVTFKFPRRDGRECHSQQKNAMVLTQFSSQRLSWPPGRLLGARIPPRDTPELPDSSPETSRTSHRDTQTSPDTPPELPQRPTGDPMI